MLSRVEEFAADNFDNHDRFEGKNSLSFKMNFLDKPIVDIYIEILWEFLKKSFTGLKRKRYNSIMSLQQKISHEINQEKVGKTFKVLIDRGDKNNYFGRTEFDSPEVDNEVIIPVKNSHLRIGEFYDTKIVGARAYDLVGKIV